MKSFTIAAFAGAATAAWAPPAYGGAESSAVVSSSQAEEYSAPAYTQPAEEYSQPPAYTQPAEETPKGYSTPAAYTTSSKASAPAYGASSSSAASYACNPAHSYPNGAQCVSTYGTLSLVTPSPSVPGSYGTGSSPGAYVPKPTGGYGGSWGHGNGTEGGYGGSWGHGGDYTVTQVVSSYETFCPYATTLTTNGATYTATESETLTITDCPCDVPTPIVSYKPSYTTEVVTSFTTTCPEAGTYTAGPSTYTVSESTVITVTDCGQQGCSVTKPVPATVVVPSYTTVCPSSGVYTIESSTYSVTESTVVTVTAPTSYETYTSVYTKPATPTSVVIESSTFPITEATTVTWSKPTQGGYTITTPVESLPVYSAPPAASTPVSPQQPSVYPGAPAPSAGYPAGNGTSPISPAIPEQTGNGAAGKLATGGAAFGAVVAALFL